MCTDEQYALKKNNFIKIGILKGQSNTCNNFTCSKVENKITIKFEINLTTNKKLINMRSLLRKSQIRSLWRICG